MTSKRIYCIRRKTLCRPTTFNCFKHKSNDIYYTTFTVILIKNMVNKRNHTMTTVLVYVTVSVSVTNVQAYLVRVHDCNRMRYAKTRITMLITALQSGQLRAKSRCQCCRSHCCSNSPKQYPYNFECIRLLLFYSVIFQSVIFQSCKFQSCKFSYPLQEDCSISWPKKRESTFPNLILRCGVT